jgi:hypothetical protein
VVIRLTFNLRELLRLRKLVMAGAGLMAQGAAESGIKQKALFLVFLLDPYNPAGIHDSVTEFAATQQTAAKPQAIDHR